MTISLAPVSPLELAGTWALRRRMHDRLSGVFGTASGWLEIGADGSWTESGRLSFGGFAGPFERRLVVRSIEDEWWLAFADGRPFHPWRLGEVVVHPCVDDLYRGFVTVAANRVRTLWDVTGPAKSQRLVTVYSRADS